MRIVLILLVLISQVAKSQQFDPSDEYFIFDTCPYECCTYEGWQLEQDISLYESKHTSSQAVTFLEANSKVNVVTLDVHLFPLKVVILKELPMYPYKVGDEYWLLDYYGEGEYKAWKDGEFTNFSATFEPYGEPVEDDWIKLDGEFRYTWWIKIKTDAGLQGWTNQRDAFRTRSKCG